MKNVNNFEIAKVQPEGVTSGYVTRVGYFANFGLALLIKVLLI